MYTAESSLQHMSRLAVGACMYTCHLRWGFEEHVCILAIWYSSCNLFFSEGGALWWWWLPCFGLWWHLVSSSRLIFSGITWLLFVLEVTAIYTLMTIRDCMSNQQLVDFIREHINTVSTKLYLMLIFGCLVFGYTHGRKQKLQTAGGKPFCSMWKSAW
jgi:hypothetical protein